MSRTEDPAAASNRTVVESYVKDVRIVRLEDGDGEDRYRFEAPRHCGAEFEDRELAELYADVFFDANGFREEGTGEIGIPPELVQAGKDTLTAYMLTQPYTDRDWLASFLGCKPGDVEKYVSWTQNRAEEIRKQVRARDDET